MKQQKQILTKLMNLNSPAADEALAKFSDELKAKIEKSTNNAERLELLGLLEEFVYKAPEQTLAIVQHIRHHPLPTGKMAKPFNIYDGATHEQVVLKAIELVEHIRYVHPDGVLPIVAELVRDENRNVQEKALQVVKNLAKYDYNVLTKSKLGYSPQRRILDFILSWSAQDQVTNFDFIETAATQLLSASVNGITASSVDTMTFHRGAVQPTDYLKKIRRETLDLVFDIYGRVSDEQQKIKLIELAGQTIYSPSGVPPREDLNQMLDEDAAYLFSLYRKILFDKKGKLTGSIATAEKIETKMYWHQRGSTPFADSARQLREDILADPFYSLFRLLAGNDMTFRQEDEENNQRGKEVEQRISEVNLQTVDQWILNLNRVAAQYGIIEDWQFNYLGFFLRKLSKEKPDIAKQILVDAMKGNKPLLEFAANFLYGWRDAGRFDLWDEFAKLVTAEKRVLLVNAIVYSLNIDRDADPKEKIRAQDLAILKQIVKQSGDFSFLKQPKAEDHRLMHATLTALVRNFKRDPEFIESLIVATLKRYKKYQSFQIQPLDLGIILDWIDFSEFTPQGKAFLEQWLIELPDLRWDPQAILLSLGKDDIKIIMDVFWGRLEKEAKQKPRRRLGRREYEAIPHDFNDRLVQHLAQQPDLNKHLTRWVEATTPDLTVKNWQIGRFLQGVGTSFKDMIHHLVDLGDDDSLQKALHLMNPVERKDFEVCLEIVAKTDNEHIWSEVGSALYSTGVVSGGDGIAKAYEARAEQLKKYLTHENERVRRFAAKAVESFTTSAKQERIRVAESESLRKIEFES